MNTTYWVEFDPQVEGRMWAARFNGGVTISDDGGRTWRKVSELLPPSAATHILLDPQSPKDARVLYMTAFARGVYKSTDGGAHWDLKNNGIDGAEYYTWLSPAVAKTRASAPPMTVRYTGRRTMPNTGSTFHFRRG